MINQWEVVTSFTIFSSQSYIFKHVSKEIYLMNLKNSFGVVRVFVRLFDSIYTLKSYYLGMKFVEEPLNIQWVCTNNN
jgi:hypothetical protein